MARPTRTERLIPFDVIPAHPGRRRMGHAAAAASSSASRRINAYHRATSTAGARSCRAGVVPEDLVFQNPVFRPEMNGQKVPHDIYVHIAGIDIVRVDADTFYVLEDNARTPSGVSYMLENREIMMRLFPGAVRAPPRRAGRELSRRAAGDAAIGRAAIALGATRPSCCSRPASTTPPITSTPSWPTSSASSWSRAATSSSRTTSSTCARPKGRSAST